MIAILIFLITKMMDDHTVTDFLLIKRNQMYGESLIRTLHYQGVYGVLCNILYSSIKLRIESLCVSWQPHYKRLKGRQTFQLCVLNCENLCCPEWLVSDISKTVTNLIQTPLVLLSHVHAHLPLRGMKVSWQIKINTNCINIYLTLLPFDESRIHDLPKRCCN